MAYLFFKHDAAAPFGRFRDVPPYRRLRTHDAAHRHSLVSTDAVRTYAAARGPLIQNSEMLATKYNPAEVEDKWYAYWMEHDLFHSEPDGSIVEICSPSGNVNVRR